MDNARNNSRGQAPGAGSPKNKKKKRSVGRIIGKIFLTLFTLCVIGVLTFYLFFQIFMQYVNTTVVPDVGVTVEELTMSEASTIYVQDNATGEWVIYETLYSSDGNRRIIEYSDLPDHLVQALVDIEDHRFWEHSGVDWYSTASAMIQTLTGGNTRGGSTITQQLLRNITDDKDVTVQRKVREIFRALEFEKSHTKEEIITLYFNRISFGFQFDGIATAAEGYFGKDVSELSLAESASLVAIINNPSLYDPFYDHTYYVERDGEYVYRTTRELNKERQELILDRMLELGHISQEECDAAKAETLLFTDSEEYKALHGEEDAAAESGGSDSVYTTWFTDAVIEDAIELIQEARGCDASTANSLLFSGGYHIYTTLDPDIQEIVDSIYEDPSNFDYPSPTGASLDSAMTITDPYTGDVLAMAGGVGEKEGSRSLNLATSPRTCGSAIKPVSVYAPAIENNVVSPATIIDDYPIRINDSNTGGWPKNDNNTYDGHTAVYDGLRRSRNTVATRVLQLLTTETSFYFMENNLGFDLDAADNALAPLAMGGLTYGVTTEEMAAAFGAFANKGIYTEPRTIIEIRENDNETVMVDNSSNAKVAMKESTAYLMNNILRSAVTNGTGGGAIFSGMTIAGKTGTTSNNFDRYFAGYTPYYSGAVWVGYAETPERIRADHNPAARIWRLVMEQVHAGLENKSFPERPDGISSVTVCADCGLRTCDLCTQSGRTVTFEVQTEAVPTETCTCHVEVKVCTDPTTGEIHLATDFCPEETCETRIMTQGREFLEYPNTVVTNEDGTTIGTPILAGDSERHLSYWEKYVGTCTVHDEDTVVLPPDEELVPGDPGYEWPDWWPWGDDEDQETDTPSEPDEPDSGNSGEDSGGTDENSGEPVEPVEPTIPDEPTEP